MLKIKLISFYESNNIITEVYLFESLSNQFGDINQSQNKLPNLTIVDIRKRIEIALHNAGKTDFSLKLQQLQCFEYMYQGNDVIAVLPTGFGKSILFQLLPDILPIKETSNIVVVVCPLFSIIEDQLNVLKVMGIKACVLRCLPNLHEPSCEST